MWLIALFDWFLIVTVCEKERLCLRRWRRLHNLFCLLRLKSVKRLNTHWNYSNTQQLTEVMARIVQKFVLVLYSGQISWLHEIIHKVHHMKLIFDSPDELIRQLAHFTVHSHCFSACIVKKGLIQSLRTKSRASQTALGSLAMKLIPTALNK